MKASSLNDLDEKGETMDHDQIVGPELGEDTEIARASLSNDGKSICLIDKTGRRHCVTVSTLESVESGKHFVGRTLMCGLDGICPYCKCLKIVRGAQIIYFDLQKNQKCGHTWCHH